MTLLKCTRVVRCELVLSAFSPAAGAKSRAKLHATRTEVVNCASYQSQKLPRKANFLNLLCPVTHAVVGRGGAC